MFFVCTLVFIIFIILNQVIIRVLDYVHQHLKMGVGAIEFFLIKLISG